MSLNKNNFLLYFSFFTVSSLLAQQEQTPMDSIWMEDLEEVIVTATRTERQLSSLPLPAQLITGKEINRINAIRLSDLLNEQTGLITVPDFGGGEGLQLQGLDSQYTLVLIDGVPLIGRSAGTFDLNRITVNNIEQVEIVKGASSSLYGNEALGGVINIITKSPANGFSGKLSSRLNSREAYDNSISINNKGERLEAGLFFNRLDSQGYDLTPGDGLNTLDPFHNYTLNTRINYELTEATSVFFSGRYFNQVQDYIPSAELQGESEIREWNGHLRFDHQFNTKWSSYLELYATNYQAEEYLNGSDGATRSSAYFDQLMIRPELRMVYEPNDKENYILGTGVTRDELDRTYFSTRPEFTSSYVYAQYDVQFLEKMNAILGLRFDHHSEYSSQLSPKAALRYEISDAMAVKGSVGYGFKAPDFRQLYFDFTNSAVGYTVIGYNVANEAIGRLEEEGQIERIAVPLSVFDSRLEPENSMSLNLGFDTRPYKQLKLSVNAFRNNIDDMIDTRVVANKTNGQNLFSYYNIHKVYTQGLEIDARWDLNSQLRISGGYQLLYAKDKEAENAFRSGDVYARSEDDNTSYRLDKGDYFGLYNRSRHMANFKIFYTMPEAGVNMNLRGTYRSKYGLFDSNGNAYLDRYDEFVDGYSVWDLAVNKTFYKNYVLGIGLDNMFGFTDTQNISNIPGRIFYGKLNINF